MYVMSLFIFDFRKNCDSNKYKLIIRFLYIDLIESKIYFIQFWESKKINFEW